MAEIYKNLGQTALPATTLTDVYTVPASTEAVISSIIVCNRGATATTFRISHAVNGAADSDEQYLYYDISIPANDTFVASLGLTLGDSDKIRAYAGNANLSVNLYGTEIS